MRSTFFEAYSPYELGDKVKGADRKEHTITDILILHSEKYKSYRFAYELDDSGVVIDCVEFERWVRKNA